MKIERMKAATACLAVAAVLICGAQAASAQEISDVDRSRRLFQEIVSRLDVGGDLLFVGNADGLAMDVLQGILADGEATPPASPEAQQGLATAERIEAFCRRNGVYALQGIGVSAAPLPDGRHAVKCFLRRDYMESGLPLWRAVFGWHPRRLSCLDFIPGDVAMVRASTSEPAALWQLIKTAYGEAADPAVRDEFARRVKQLSDVIGIPVETVVDSLRDEVMISVRFLENQPFVLPSAGGPIALPVPEILLCVSAKNSVLRGVIEAQLGKLGMTIVETVVGDSTMRTASQALPFSMPVQPAFATQSGFFLLGSSTNIVSDALLAYQHKNGLTSRPEFIQGFSSLPMVNNGIVYVSPTMSAAVADIRTQLSHARGAVTGPFARLLIDRLMSVGDGYEQSAVILNWKRGVMIMGNCTWGGKAAMRQFLARPIAAAAAFSLPEMFGIGNALPAPAAAAPIDEKESGAGDP